MRRRIDARALRPQGGAVVNDYTRELQRHARLLAVTGRYEESRVSYERLSLISEGQGNYAAAADSRLQVIESLGSHIHVEHLASNYEHADRLAALVEDEQLLSRLRSAARRIISRGDLQPDPASARFIHASKVMGRIIGAAFSYSTDGTPTLVSGEHGTGKTTLARLMHWRSKRRGDFVEFNCADVPEGKLFETLAAIEGGTIYLNEFAELTPGNQSGLLTAVIDADEPTRRRVLQLIASTKHTPASLLTRDDMNAGLVTYLLRAHLTIPPLRERSEDIPELAEQFIAAALASQRRADVSFAPDAVSEMRSLRLRGNARESARPNRAHGAFVPG